MPAAAVVVNPAEVEFTAVRSQGAGGQNVNKVSSAAHLRFDIMASSLPDEVKLKLCALADQPLRIGIVACGYADGYPRHAGTGTPVLVDGMRTRTVGRVSMDMLAVDLTPVPQAGIGSEATLWGRSSNGAVLAIDEVAHAAGTIGYELMCAVAARVPMTTGD